MAGFDIDSIRAQFPILSRTVYGKPLVYLDNGATAQKPLRVIEKLDWLARDMNANVHRGVHYLSERCTEHYEAARETVRAFINASSRQEIVFTSGATAAINLVAFSFGERYVLQGDNVIVSEMEHHSNIVPWQMMCRRKGAQLRVLPFDDQGRLMDEMLGELIDDRTRIVAVTQASNVLGTCPDLSKIIGVSHDRGVPVLVDGCQGIVHGGVDVAAIGCDFYAFSGHKLYGPTGIGVLYAKQKFLDEIPPYMGGGDMVDTVTFEKTTYAELPLKFEAGTANYMGAIGMAEAIGFVAGIDATELRRHEDGMTEALMRRLDAIAGVTIYGRQAGKCPIVSFSVEGVHPFDIGMIVDKMGVAIRTGTHCAEPVMAHFGVTGMCRASFAVYNTMQEMEVFADSLEKALGMLR